MTERDRIVVVGAGHNGLACAAYLARAGREVVVVEAAAQVGGAAITREFSKGFRVSGCAHLSYLLDAGIARDLKLASHGLKWAREGLQTVALSPSGDHLVYRDGRLESGTLSETDRKGLADYHARMLKFARIFAKQHNRMPPRLGGRADLRGAAAIGLDIRMLGREDMREFLRIAGINIYDVLEEIFESPLLKGSLALDAVLGANLGPRSNNSVLALLHRLSGQAAGNAGLSIPEGGMGAIGEAMAAAARAAGATIRTAAPVRRITLDGDRVSGVELESGEKIAAGTVISNADPATTLFKLLGARHLEAGFVHRVRHFRHKGMAAKLHLALEALPTFTRLASELAGERLVISPDMTYLEHAFDAAKYGATSPDPALEVTIPSLSDKSLAPPGKHVLSAVVLYAPFDPRANGDGARRELLDRALSVLDRHAPGLRRQVVASELLLPVDIEREFRITGGHWHHGELALDQFMMLRPVPGAAQYAMPVGGLYLCGAGCHPGGGVMGSAGRNAANAVLATERAA
jgi:phytoene dehydrogenase-like protein